MRFSHQNAKLYAAVSALQLESSNFLCTKMVSPLLDVVVRTGVEAEFDVIKINGDEKTKLTTTKLFSEHCEALKTMPTVHLELKLGVTLRAYTTKCENSFFVLKTTMRDRRQLVKHACKAHLIQIALESDLTKKLKTECKENVF